jgi:hypothetical protein
VNLGYDLELCQGCIPGIPGPPRQQQLLRRDGQADARVGVEAGVAALHLAAAKAFLLQKNMVLRRLIMVNDIKLY